MKSVFPTYDARDDLVDDRAADESAKDTYPSVETLLAMASALEEGGRERERVSQH